MVAKSTVEGKLLRTYVLLSCGVDVGASTVGIVVVAVFRVFVAFDGIGFKDDEGFFLLHVAAGCATTSGASNVSLSSSSKIVVEAWPNNLAFSSSSSAGQNAGGHSKYQRPLWR